MGNTRTLLSAFGVDTSPDDKYIRLESGKGRLRLDVISIAPANATIEVELVELVNPQYVVKVEDASGFEVGRMVRNDLQSASGVVVATDTTENANTLTLIRYAGRFVNGESVTEVGDSPASTVIRAGGFERVWQEGEALAEIAATNADATADLTLTVTQPEPCHARLKTTLSLNTTGASFLVRLKG